MCNIAGYVGRKAAAPILIEMMQQQEGYNGGFYTGIATIHEGKLFHAKRTGNTQYLIEHTNAAALPGTIGIMHSRTNDGGGDVWAHPFIGYHGEEPVLAYLGNGAMGHFMPRKTEYLPLVEELLDEGYAMARIAHTENKPYLELSDGSHVHMSDAMCQLILRYMDRGSETADALEAAFCRMPAEVVALTLNAKQPSCVPWARINMPMYLGFAEHGAYLASTPAAFPADVITEPMLLPPCASGYVYSDHFSAKPMRQPPARMAPMDPRIRQQSYAAVCQRLGQESVMYPDLVKMVREMFSGWDLNPANALVYEAMYDLLKQGRLKIESRQVPAARDDLYAYKHFFHL